jgi:hypothetical protein
MEERRQCSSNQLRLAQPATLSLLCELHIKVFAQLEGDHRYGKLVLRLSLDCRSRKWSARSAYANSTGLDQGRFSSALPDSTNAALEWQEQIGSL